MYGACAWEDFSKEVIGTLFGLMTIFCGIGVMMSPVLTGYLADITGTFRWSFGLGRFVSFVAAFLIGFLKELGDFGKDRD
jgi:MFS family permease